MRHIQRYFPLILVLLVGLTVLPSIACSASIDEVKNRMKNRLPAIDQLKDQGIVGENNRGYLEFRSQSAAAEPQVKAENADRKAVYGQIAKQQRASISAVEKSAARSIVQRAQKGHWFQGEDGKWQKK